MHSPFDSFAQRLRARSCAEKANQIQQLEQENSNLKDGAPAQGGNVELQAQMKKLQEENTALKASAAPGGASGEGSSAELDRMKAACAKQQAMLKKLAAERQRMSRTNFSC